MRICLTASKRFGVKVYGLSMMTSLQPKKLMMLFALVLVCVGAMGLFETYRIAGGEAGMAHFITQFGPCLKWPGLNSWMCRS